MHNSRNYIQFWGLQVSSLQSYDILLLQSANLSLLQFHCGVTKNKDKLLK